MAAVEAELRSREGPGFSCYFSSGHAVGFQPGGRGYGSRRLDAQGWSRGRTGAFSDRAVYTAAKWF